MMSSKGKDTVDAGLHKALAHPLRHRILQLLNQRVASPNELAQALDEPLGNVSYHVKILERYQAIELVSTATVRGAIEHFYRAMTRPIIADPDHWSKLPLSARRRLFDQDLQDIWTHLSEAAAADGFDDPRTHLSWSALELDEEALDKLTEELAAIDQRAMDLHAEAAARLAELPEEEREVHRTELAILHFHRAAKASGRRKGSAKPRRRAQASS
jgi:DNA-binding transcriptional ArsR family regulator